MESGQSKPGTIQYYISLVSSNMSDMDSTLFMMACKSFQNFYEKGFRQIGDLTNPQYRIDEALSAISFSTLNNTQLTMILLYLIAVSQDTDKSYKANRICRDLQPLGPEKNPLIWDYFEKIIVWAAATLKASFSLVLETIITKAVGWCNGENDETKYPGYRLLTILITHFPASLESSITHYRAIVTKAFKNQNKEFYPIALEALKALLSTDKTSHHEIIGLLMKPFKSGKVHKFPGISFALWTILQLYPDDKIYVKFTSLPIDHLFGKDQTQKLYVVQALPIMMKAAADLFTKEQLQNIFKAFEPLLKKKSPGRNEALLAFAQFIFEKGIENISEDIDFVKKCRKEVIELVDTPEAAAALLASDMFRQDHLAGDSSKIYNHLSSLLLSEAIKGFLKNIPAFTDIIYKNVVIYSNDILLSLSSPYDKVINLFAVLNDLDVPASKFSPALALEYSAHLGSASRDVRIACVRFLLKYIRDCQAIEVMQRVISFVATESNPEIRLEILNNLTIEQSSSNYSIIIAIESLLHDLNQPVASKAFEIIVKMCDHNAVPNIISQVLSEKLKYLQNTSEIFKEDIEPFRVVAIAAYSDSSRPYAANAQQVLSPFVQFLIKHLLASKKRLAAGSLQLLALILPSSSASFSVPLLVQHIEASLLPHSSYYRLSATLDLMYAALKYTDLRNHLVEEYSPLLAKFMTITNMSKNSVDRKRLLNVLGLIGAPKPSLVLNWLMNDKTESQANVNSPNIFITRSDSNDPYQSLMSASIGVGLINILDILGDENLATLHAIAIEALIKFLKAYRALSDDFEALLMARVEQLLQSRGTSTLSVLLTNMATLVTSLGPRFKPLVGNVIDLICEQWGKIDPVTFTRTTEWLAISLPKVFVNYLPRIAMLFTKDLQILPAKSVQTILSCLVSFGSLLAQVDHMIIPPILEWITDNANNTADCQQVLVRFKQICIMCGTQKFAGPIYSTLISVTKLNKDLHNAALDVIFVVSCQIGAQFSFHKQILQEVFDFTKIPDFQLVAALLEMGGNLPQAILEKVYPPSDRRIRAQTAPKPNSVSTPPIHDVPEFTIPNTTYSESNWIIWYNEISAICFNESPSKAVCACNQIVERHTPAHDSLFPVAFAIYYFAAEHKGDDRIQQIMKNVFKSTSIPRNILKHFLAVIELIEVCGANIPINIQAVKTRAQGVNNIAQALRFAEKMFDDGQEEVSEDLIVMNQQLGLPLAANGILRVSSQRAGAQGELSERLGLWDDALSMYNEKLKEDPNNQRYIIGRLTCLNELARFKELKEAVKDDPRNAFFLGSAAYHLFDDETFMNVAKDISPKSRVPYDLFLALIYSIKAKEFKTAEDIIHRLHLAKVDKIFPMIYEDYERAYDDTSLISITQELSEVIQYIQAKDHASQPNPSEVHISEHVMDRIKKRWKYRFQFLPDRPTVLFQHIRVQSLVLGFEDLRQQYLQYLDCAIRHGESNLVLLESTLDYLLKDHPSDSDLRFHSARLQWMKGDHAEAYFRMEDLSKEGGDNVGLIELTLSNWHMSEGKPDQAIAHISEAVKNLPQSAEAWNLSSFINLEMYELTKQDSFIIRAIEHAFNGLSNSVNDPLSFTLRILSILFNNRNTKVYDVFAARIGSIPVHVWIDVLPQMIARASTDDDKLRYIITKLLANVAKEHPQVILYSLMVPFRDDKTSRQKVAAQIMDLLQDDYPEIYKSMMQVTDEMIRVAVTWWELWFGTLDEASRAYLLRNDIEEMISLLEPLNEAISKPATTFFETSFLASFGSQLATATAYIREYQQTNDEQCVLQAWQIYYSVYQDLKPIVNAMSNIPLTDASPIMNAIRSSPIIVPGTYHYGQNLIKLQSFDKALTVMKSKQRPRRMVMFGDDGKKYTFLLKAHEDTRLDERVMQLFGFINTLVDHSDIPMKNHLDITTYKVIPLTTSVGLIGWVPGCTTVYDQIKMRREKAGIPLEIECQTTYKAAPNFETLELEDKLFAFRRGLQVTKGDDLKILMLANATDSSHWIERRTAYSTSLAMTSMSGYILGLGDRHLCNIMIKQKSAKLVHIDFGDCFEVAQHREKAPEKVPFRLTRILTNALEVSRIEGTFRSCCENVITLMRRNSETINGILEVFVYDPLQQWIEAAKADAKSDSNDGGAKVIISRIKDKLSGKDFTTEKLNVEEQVNRLIGQATDQYNLCQMFKGWHAWW